MTFSVHGSRFTLLNSSRTPIAVSVSVSGLPVPDFKLLVPFRTTPFFATRPCQGLRTNSSPTPTPTPTPTRLFSSSSSNQVSQLLLSLDKMSIADAEPGQQQQQQPPPPSNEQTGQKRKRRLLDNETPEIPLKKPPQRVRQPPPEQERFKPSKEAQRRFGKDRSRQLADHLTTQFPHPETLDLSPYFDAKGQLRKSLEVFKLNAEAKNQLRELYNRQQKLRGNMAQPQPEPQHPQPPQKDNAGKNQKKKQEKKQKKLEIKAAKKNAGGNGGGAGGKGKAGGQQPQKQAGGKKSTAGKGKAAPGSPHAHLHDIPRNHGTMGALPSGTPPPARPRPPPSGSASASGSGSGSSAPQRPPPSPLNKSPAPALDHHESFHVNHPLLSAEPRLPILSALPNHVQVTYTTSPAVVDAFCDTIGLGNLAILGLDTETRPQFRKGLGQNPPSVLQLSTESHAIVIHLRRHGRNDTNILTSRLREVLASPKVLKVGVRCVEDGKGLAKHWQIAVNGCIDVDRIAEYYTGARIFGESKHERLVRLEKMKLEREAKAAMELAKVEDSVNRLLGQGEQEPAPSTVQTNPDSFNLDSAVSSINNTNKPLLGYGLKNLSDFFLSHALSKPKSIQLSNWEQFPLSRGQVQYAALDAWISLVLFRRVAELAGGENLRRWEEEAGKEGHFR